ncbi:maleylpyruvate isomerase N-terminal domain-containing protein [Streptomyces sp. NPDC090025]|uniref:maleylpyruvate isomerase N-terminal domain-containing protein n=1 Tax=Streptomyces sp. NPDC090025 TaxID=3365922 RepID=UPI0038376875
MSEALLSALTEALAELVTAVGTADEEVLDPGTGTAWRARTARVLDRLPAADRRTLDRLLQEAALRRPGGPRPADLLKAPAGGGLTDPHDAHRHARRLDLVAAHVDRLLALVRTADPATPVPSRPGWTLADLVEHHGTTHRWTEHLVRTRATTRVLARDVPLGLPADPAERPDWLAASAATALAALRAADPGAPLWSYGADPHVRFFARRLLFEGVVHVADAELALGRPVGPIDPGTAADGIEELLENLPYFGWAAEPVAQLDRDGAVVRFLATDTGAGWTLTLGGGGFAWRRAADGAATVTVEGAVADLLLLLHGRYRADAPRFTVTGDRTVLDAWLTATAV